MVQAAHQRPLVRLLGACLGWVGGVGGVGRGLHGAEGLAAAPVAARLRLPNSPNPVRAVRQPGNPKPGHLPRAHGNGGLGDARGRDRGGGAVAALALFHLHGTPHHLIMGTPGWLHPDTECGAQEPSCRSQPKRGTWNLTWTAVWETNLYVFYGKKPGDVMEGNAINFMSF